MVIYEDVQSKRMCVLVGMLLVWEGWDCQRHFLCHAGCLLATSWALTLPSHEGSRKWISFLIEWLSARKDLITYLLSIATGCIFDVKSSISALGPEHFFWIASTRIMMMVMMKMIVVQVTQEEVLVISSSSHMCHQLSAGVPLLRIAWENSGIHIQAMDIDDLVMTITIM